MRGEHCRGAPVLDLPGGIIPACAGSAIVSAAVSHVVGGSSPHARGAPTSPPPCGRGLRDHPRMRGEHKRFVRSAFMYSGSYPHARGAPGVRVLEEALRGIIPACAGSTGRRKGLVLMFGGSSPHARGAPIEHPSALVPSRDHPRMRGEHCNDERGRVLARGIIPACAGSTSAMLAFDSRIWGSSPHARGARTRGAGRDRRPRDHPRMRGEHGIHRVVVQSRVGIIPACAGSTTVSMSWRTKRPGSSPHARGALSRRKGLPCVRKDHPRMRGEH